ncbi:uncharacterized protein [Drosophila kikkawai]|uniref:Uncharacterized protein n=1 Tax=Drosophila kikkawai TaxID=30033 RepID=A0A6P4JHI5_DROKI|nr:uncharacterized protein LOC108083680 [Drosophila kikkawai]
MIRATKCLWVIVFLVLFIHRNRAATNVLYEFHIREASREREEKGVLKDASEDSRAEPELIVTGKRTSGVVLPFNNISYVYMETATYVADNSGYHVKYNFTLEPLEGGPRLNGQTLKSTVG